MDRNTIRCELIVPIQMPYEVGPSIPNTNKNVSVIQDMCEKGYYSGKILKVMVTNAQKLVENIQLIHSTFSCIYHDSEYP